MRSRDVRILLACALAAVIGYLLLDHLFSSPTKQVQIIWTLAGVVGMIVTTQNLVEAVKDMYYLDVSGKNGNLKLMAKAGIRIEALRVSKMVAIVIIGVTALVTAPVITAAQRKALHIPEWTTTGVMLTALLFWVVLGTVLQALLDQRLRYHFYHDGDGDENG